MKKALPIILFFLFLACLYSFLRIPKIKPVYLSPKDQLVKPNEPSKAHEIYDIVKEINKENEKIKSLYVAKMPISLQQNGINAKAYGELAMQKDKRFRLKITHSLTGKEMDIGSNDEFFWFWSKRMDPPFLHFAKHEDLEKTMLRTALNPEWFIESINVNKIDLVDIKITNFKEFIGIYQSKLSATGEPVTVLILINPVEKKVKGRYLYNENDKMIASTEYQEEKILIIWYEEGIILNWDLSSARKNVGIDPSFWIMPNMKNKINMGE